MVNTDSSIDEEIKERIAAGNRAYHVHKNRKCMFTNTGHNMFTKIGHTLFTKIGHIMPTK